MHIGRCISIAAIAGLALACNAERHDAAVNQAVMAKLSEDPQLAQNAVNVETDHGHVTLTGQVISEDQRQTAEKRAQEVTGVKDVTNHIEIAVSSPPASSDAPAPPSATDSPNMPPAQPGREHDDGEPE